MSSIIVMEFYVLTASILLLVLLVLVDYIRILRLRSKMPPGPLPLPLIGNVLQLPKSKPWYRFEEWSQKYKDPMITVWIGRAPTIVLNDAWTASELMDKRANIYSSRPVFQVPGVVMGGDNWSQTMAVYGDKWRKLRKMTVAPSLAETNLAPRSGGTSCSRSSRFSIRRVARLDQRSL